MKFVKFTRKQLFLAVCILLISTIGTLAQSAFPSVVERVNPKYPAAAMALRAGGAVRLSCEIDSSGKVVLAKATSGHPLLRRMAEITVEKWLFSSIPGTHFITISIQFDIGKQDEDIVTILSEYNLHLLGARSRIDTN